MIDVFISYCSISDGKKCLVTKQPAGYQTNLGKHCKGDHNLILSVNCGKTYTVPGLTQQAIRWVLCLVSLTIPIRITLFINKIDRQHCSAFQCKRQFIVLGYIHSCRVAVTRNCDTLLNYAVVRLVITCQWLLMYCILKMALNYKYQNDLTLLPNENLSSTNTQCFTAFKLSLFSSN